jgi:hypothetical protein
VAAFLDWFPVVSRLDRLMVSKLASRAYKTALEGKKWLFSPGFGDEGYPRFALLRWECQAYCIV